MHSQLCIALIDLYECITQHRKSKPSREIEMFLSCIPFWLDVSVIESLVQTSVRKLASSFLKIRADIHQDLRLLFFYQLTLLEKSQSKLIAESKP